MLLPIAASIVRLSETLTRIELSLISQLSNTMDADFWHNKWQRNELGFHNSEPHPLLLKYWPRMNVAAGARILLPLAGKSVDIRWLADQKFAVTAVDLSELAADAFFLEQHWSARKETKGYNQTKGHYLHYRHDDIDFIVGDFLQLGASDIEQCTAAYDRAALIALPENMRRDYVDTLARLLSAGANYLLISLEYDESVLNGPPFTIEPNTIARLYETYFHINPLGRHSADVKGAPATEVVYQMTRKS